MVYCALPCEPGNRVLDVLGEVRLGVGGPELQPWQDRRLRRDAVAVQGLAVVGVAELQLAAELEDPERFEAIADRLVHAADAERPAVGAGRVGDAALPAEDVPAVGGVARDVVVDGVLLADRESAGSAEVHTHVAEAVAEERGLDLVEAQEAARRRGARVELGAAADEVHSPLPPREELDLVAGRELEPDEREAVLELDLVVVEGAVGHQEAVGGQVAEEGLLRAAERELAAAALRDPDRARVVVPGLPQHAVDGARLLGERDPGRRRRGAHLALAGLRLALDGGAGARHGPLRLRAGGGAHQDRRRQGGQRHDSSRLHSIPLRSPGHGLPALIAARTSSSARWLTVRNPCCPRSRSMIMVTTTASARTPNSATTGRRERASPSW